jgi:nitroreductase
MSNQNAQKLPGVLEWRYATKVFDPNKKIPVGIWEILERTLVLSPSSYGLQPYRFIVMTDPAKRAELLPHAWNQRQIVDCSHLVVFTARTEMTGADVDRLIQRTSQIRKILADSLNSYRDMMLGDLVNGPRSKIARDWAARQAYLALGNLLTSAAVLGVDACPMEGFVPAEFDDVLGLKNSGYAAVVICALGYRSPDDKYSKLPKVRFDAKELVQHV